MLNDWLKSWLLIHTCPRYPRTRHFHPTLAFKCMRPQHPLVPSLNCVLCHDVYVCLYVHAKNHYPNRRGVVSYLDDPDHPCSSLCSGQTPYPRDTPLHPPLLLAQCLVLFRVPVPLSSRHHCVCAIITRPVCPCRYKWMLAGWNLDQRLTYFQQRWAYFASYGRALSFSLRPVNNVCVSCRLPGNHGLLRVSILDHRGCIRLSVPIGQRPLPCLFPNNAHNDPRLLCDQPIVYCSGHPWKADDWNSIA